MFGAWERHRIVSSAPSRCVLRSGASHSLQWGVMPALRRRFRIFSFRLREMMSGMTMGGGILSHAQERTAPRPAAGQARRFWFGVLFHMLGAWERHRIVSSAPSRCVLRSGASHSLQWGVMPALRRRFRIFSFRLREMMSGMTMGGGFFHTHRRGRHPALRRGRRGGFGLGDCFICSELGNDTELFHPRRRAVSCEAALRILSNGESCPPCGGDSGYFPSACAK